MSKTRDLLIELGTEELPPKALKRLAEAFTAGIRDGLDKAELTHGKLHSYAAPRRLAIRIEALASRQPDKEIERRGPALTAAFGDDGCPSKAALGFARSCGVADVADLEQIETDKGAWLVHRFHQAGQDTTALVPDIVQNALDKLPIPKRMRWGALDVQFVRPVHWLVLLFGEEVIPAELLGVHSGRETRGHRFHHPQAIAIGTPADYAPLLESEGHVLADFAARRAAIHAQVTSLAAELGQGTRAVIDEDLLDEVTAMVEWPVAVLGNFEARFLDVPAEALISTMKANQKYFHLVDARGKLLPHFITISNVDSREPAQVRAGNERVVRARLADAEFFWQQDRKQPLHARRAGLAHVVFQQKLGTLLDKSERVAQLAAAIAGEIAASAGTPVDSDLAMRAGELSKCDLLTEMVGEFPELQGTMGRYYAVHDGEPAELAVALDEQYLPRFAGDRLPGGPVAQALAIADRLDTLIGIFGIGQLPSGDKDPFALRRAALGVLRILIEGELELDLYAMLELAQTCYGKVLPEAKGDKKPAGQVFDFMMERLRGYCLDAGHAHDAFEAVLAQRPTRPRDFYERICAVSEFRRLPEAESLAAANKRISNILRQATAAVPQTVDKTLLTEAAERTLAEQVERLTGEVAPMLAAHDYTATLQHLAALRSAVDAFFDEVMVMVDDTALRDNRLALLQGLRKLFLEVADLSHLQG